MIYKTQFVSSIYYGPLWIYKNNKKHICVLRFRKHAWLFRFQETILIFTVCITQYLIRRLSFLDCFITFSWIFYEKHYFHPFFYVVFYKIVQYACLRILVFQHKIPQGRFGALFEDLFYKSNFIGIFEFFLHNWLHISHKHMLDLTLFNIFIVKLFEI